MYRITAIFVAAMVSGSLLLASQAHAQQRETIQDVLRRTAHLLPPYCNARLNGPPADAERWARAMGPGFLHVHHHCFGLAQVIAAQTTTDARKRNEYLVLARGDFDYMVRHVKPGELTILPEVYVERAKVHLELRDFPKAQADFEMARRLSQGLAR